MVSPPDSVSKEDAASRGMRSESRDSLFLLGKMGVEGGVALESVRIRNLSPTGMMAEAPTQLAVGTAVRVELRNLPIVSGRIVWATDGRMGVAFNSEIDPQKARQPVGVAEDPSPSFIKVSPGRRPGLKLS